MALRGRLLRTTVFIVENDRDFIRSLKQVFARGMENHRFNSFDNADSLIEFIQNVKFGRLERPIFVVPLSAHVIKGDKGIYDVVEIIRQLSTRAYVILLHEPKELDPAEVEKLRAEVLVDDVITKDNYARSKIQNSIRRIVSRDDFSLRRQLMILSGIATLLLLITTVLLFFL